MATVKSTKYPELWVHDLGVRFHNGVAEVSDSKTLDALRGVDGVEVPEEPKRRSRKSGDED